MRCSFLLILLVVLSISCDSEVGFDGVVLDFETGQPIPGVMVRMHSEDQGSKEDVTDSVGYFNTFKTFSCGLSSCNTRYDMTFSKENYEQLTIGDTYFNDAEYLDAETRDTIIVKLIPSN